VGGLRNTPGGRALEEQERLNDPRREAALVYGTVEALEAERALVTGGVGRRDRLFVELTAHEVQALRRLIAEVLNVPDWPWPVSSHSAAIRRVQTKLPEVQ
jgi:hypothetical protein